MTPSKAQELATLQMKTLLTYGTLDDVYITKQDIAEETARTMKAFLENDFKYLIEATYLALPDDDTPERKQLEYHIEMLETMKILHRMEKGDGYIVQEHF